MRFTLAAEPLNGQNLILGQSATIDGINVLSRLELFAQIAEISGEVAADIGCGNGPYARELSRRFERVIGVDLQAEHIEQARKLNIPNAEFRCSDAGELPIDSNSVDAAFSIEVLDHVPDVDSALSELRRILKPEGKLFISVPNAYYPLETHPVKIGKRLMNPLLFPFLNWSGLHDSFATARVFRRKVLTQKLSAAGFRVLGSSYLIQPFEHRLQWAKSLIETLGKTPLRPVLGCSLLLVAKRAR